MRMSDEAIVKRCLAGEVNAFSVLVEKYQNAVYGLCYHMSGNFTDAQDLAQEAFVRAYLDLAKIRDPSKFASWLYRLTVNICRMWLRRQKRLNNLPLDEAFRIRQWSGDGRAPDECIENEELSRTIREAMASLSERNRLAITLHYIDGLSYEEIGSFLSLSRSAVKSRLHRARKQLRKEFISMVKGEFDKHKLPEDFPEKVVQAVEVKSVLVGEREGEYSGAALILQSKADEKQLLIIHTGLREGVMIARELGKMQLSMPTTLDFMTDVLKELDMKVLRTVVTDIDRGTFYARIAIQNNGKLKEIDVRPTDSIALALRTNAPIFVARSVLSEHAVKEAPKHFTALNERRLVFRHPKEVSMVYRPIDEEDAPIWNFVELNLPDFRADFVLRKEDKKVDHEEFRLVEVQYQGAVLPPAFSINPKFLDDLDSDNISEELRREFGNNSISLSHNVSSRGVCLYSSPLFRLDLMLRSDLDSGNISEGLRQEFESNGFELSQNAKFVTQREKDKWLIRGGDKQHLIREIGEDIFVSTLLHKHWHITDEDYGKEYLITKESSRLNIYLSDEKQSETALAIV